MAPARLTLLPVLIFNACLQIHPRLQRTLFPGDLTAATAHGASASLPPTSPPAPWLLSRLYTHAAATSSSWVGVLSFKRERRAAAVGESAAAAPAAPDGEYRRPQHAGGPGHMTLPPGLSASARARMRRKRLSLLQRTSCGGGGGGSGLSSSDISSGSERDMESSSGEDVGPKLAVLGRAAATAALLSGPFGAPSSGYGSGAGSGDEMPPGATGYGPCGDPLAAGGPLDGALPAPDMLLDETQLADFVRAAQAAADASPRYRSRRMQMGGVMDRLNQWGAGTWMWISGVTTGGWRGGGAKTGGV